MKEAHDEFFTIAGRRSLGQSFINEKEVSANAFFL
jgi:hypothetical protein